MANQQSVILVAHPDDEILWFSSMVEKVDRILICFGPCPSRKDWTVGRAKSLKELPLNHITSLNIVESEVFNLSHFDRPVLTEYGLKIKGNGHRTKNYVNNYATIREKIKFFLQGVDKVYTHNPWGEYGNEEHVQVYRAVKSLQSEMGYEIWFDNYASNKTAPLMLDTINRFNPKIEAKTPNSVLGFEFMQIYKKNACWTWYGHWKWPYQDVFIKDGLDCHRNSSGFPGTVLPINMIHLETNRKQSKTDRFKHLAHKIIDRI